MQRRLEALELQIQKEKEEAKEQLLRQRMVCTATRLRNFVKRVFCDTLVHVVLVAVISLE